MPAMLTRILPARRAQTSSLLSNSYDIRDAASAENGICWGEPCRRAALSPGKRAYRTSEIFQTPWKPPYRHRLPAKGYPEDALRRQRPILSGPKENTR